MGPTVAPRADLVERAQPFLPEGTVVRQAFIAQTAPSFGWIILTYLTGYMGRNTYLCVVVADDAIHVLESAKTSGGARPRRLIGSMPRRTRLGPVSNRWGRLTLLGGTRCWVHARFFAQVDAADREAGW